MSEGTAPGATAWAGRAATLFGELRHAQHRATDRMFAGLMVCQWLFAMLLAIWIAPHTWEGSASSPSMHLFLAVGLGGCLTAMPVWLALHRPGRAVTRHTIAVCQAMTSALLIHLTGGRIETHFHVFGSLAFLSFYRDWRVLLTATVVVAVDHCARGWLVPQSVYGILTVSPWRWLEHAAWVVFEDCILVWACLRGVREMRETAERRAQLEATQEIIEREVVQRTAELAVARDEALAASRAKSEFLANMSHEIRTPMNGVIGMTSLLLDTELTLEQRSFAEAVRNSSDALLVIVNDILDFSKVEAGKLQLEREPFDLAVLTEEVADLLGPLARKKGLDLVLHYGSEAPRHLFGDPGRLRQVLVNLVGNAVKFTAAGHVSLTVRGETGADGRAHLQVRVEDTGIGIAADALPGLFTMFHQVDGSTTRKFGGTGLGLAISRRLLELMHSTIEVQSTPGEGSVFSFALVLDIDPAPPRHDVALPDLRGLRVLVVDDNAVNQRVVYEQLHKHAIVCALASSGREALQALDAAHAAGRPFDLVLLDFQMPEMDGGLLGAEIHAREAHRHVPLIMLSSVQDPLEPELIEGIGLARLLVKPVRESSLVAAIGRVVGRQAHASAAVPRAANVATPPAGVARRVLLVEDNAINQVVARRLLEKLGCHVIVAGNGEEALAAGAGGRFDLVLMDVQMPVMDGCQASEQWRRREAATGTRTPIVALTANAMERDARQCLAAGMDDHVAKPVRMHELAAVLQRWAPVAPPAPSAT